MTDYFVRPLEKIDHDLHEQWLKRENGVAEILHGCFQTQRADERIEHLLAERSRATTIRGDDNPDGPVSALPHARLA